MCPRALSLTQALLTESTKGKQKCCKSGEAVDQVSWSSAPAYRVAWSWPPFVLVLELSDFWDGILLGLPAEPLPISVIGWDCVESFPEEEEEGYLLIKAEATVCLDVLSDLKSIPHFMCYIDHNPGQAPHPWIFICCNNNSYFNNYFILIEYFNSCF